MDDNIIHCINDKTRFVIVSLSDNNVCEKANFPVEFTPYIFISLYTWTELPLLCKSRIVHVKMFYYPHELILPLS